MGSEKCGLGRLCSNFSVFFVVLANIVCAFGGVALVSGGIYLWTNFQEFEEMISQQVMIYVICSGLILFMLSMVAIIGALNKMKKLLALYIVFLLVAIVGQAFFGYLLYDYFEELDLIAEEALTSQTGGDDGLNSRSQEINDFLLRSYQTCCVLDEDNCPLTTNSTANCEPVQTCDSVGADIVDVCLHANDIVVVDQAVCTAFQELSATSDIVLIGSFEEGCGLGQPENFIADAADLFFEKLEYVAIGTFVLGGIEFLVFLFSMFILFGHNVDKNRRNFFASDYSDYPTAVVVPTPITEQQARRMTLDNANRLSLRHSQTRNLQQSNRSLGASPRSSLGRQAREVSQRSVTDSQRLSASRPLTQLQVLQREAELGFNPQPPPGPKPRREDETFDRETMKNNPDIIDSVL